MKGFGNYREIASTTSERRLAQLVLYRGTRASIRFLDGTTQSLAAEPFRRMGLVEGAQFVMVVTFKGRSPVNVTFEAPTEARGPVINRSTPKVMVRTGMKVTTRR